MKVTGVSGVIDTLDYSQYSNRQLLVVPLAVFGIAMLVLVGMTVLTGSPVGLGVEFVGGTELRLAADGVEGNPEAAVSSAFSTPPDSVQTVPSDNTYIVTFKDTGQDVTVLEEEAEAAGFTVRSSSDIAPSFGSDTQRLATIGIFAAFIGMSLMVFLLFRTFVPSIAVVASALSDVTVPLAMMALLGIDLTLGTVAALLMLIGYSVDSDILLNDYLLRRSGSFYESVYSAMDTGVTMTLTSLLAMSVMAVAATALGVPLLRDIGLIIAFGLVVDLMNTYMMNLSLLRWYKFEGVSR